MQLTQHLKIDNCLEQAGYITVGKLVEKINKREDLKKLRNCGEKTVDEIMEQLFCYQYSQLYERARLYKAIVTYEKEKKNSPEKEYMVLKKLEENNAYFMNLTAEDKKTFDGIFREADDNLGKSAEWQNYFMIYTDLQVMALNNQINSYLLQGKEKKEQIKRFEDAKNALQDAGNKLRYNAVNTIARFQETEKEENKLIAAKKKLKDSRLKEKADVSKLYEKVKDVRNDIGKHPGQLESLRNDKKDIISTLKYFNKLKTEEETEYANSKQAIETELKKERQELENLKAAKGEMKEKSSKTQEEWYTWGENYGNENLKRYTSAMKNRYKIGAILGVLENLKEDPEFQLSECIYGKEDSKIREKYKMLDWIKEYLELKKDSEELKARQVKEAEEAERKVEEIENSVVENEKVEVEEKANDGVENENSEKKEFKIVEGVTTYDELITAMNDELDKIDDVYWEEMEINVKELPEDVVTISKNFEKIVDDINAGFDKKNEEIAAQEKKINEKEEQAPKKMEEAKKTFDKAVEEAYDQFNPRRENGYSFLHYELFEGDYKTFPEQVEGVVKKLEEKIEKKEAKLPELQQKLKEAEATYEKAKQNFLDGEKNYEAADTDLFYKVTEAGYAKKKYEKDYLQLKPAIENFAKTYRATFYKMPSQEYTEMVPLIQEQAKEWLKVEGMHAGDHKNSVEYARMIASVKIVANFPGSLDEKDEKLFKEAELPGNINQAVAFMKEQAENYQKAKDKQWRPFPSRMRTHHKNVAKFLIGFADKAQKGMDAQKEVVELDQYLLTEGKSKGLDLTRDNLINKVMEDEKLEHPRGRKQLDGIVVEKTDTQKETKETKAPELEDDGGMSMR